MREVSLDIIEAAVARLVQEANFDLGADVCAALREAAGREESPEGRRVLSLIQANANLAASDRVPMCQDTGMTLVFLEVGQDVHLQGNGESLETAVNQGLASGTREGYLRASVVSDPLERTNTGDNTPAVLHVRLVPGDRVRVVVAPKGAGSENMSRLKMLRPADGEGGVEDFVVRAVEEAGASPCPPVIVGVGLGGTAEKATLLAKEALLLPLDRTNSVPRLAALEKRVLDRVNQSGIGPAGYGGRTTALAVRILTYPCHIASLPVAVCLNCHAARHREEVV